MVLMIGIRPFYQIYIRILSDYWKSTKDIWKHKLSSNFSLIILVSSLRISLSNKIFCNNLPMALRASVANPFVCLQSICLEAKFSFLLRIQIVGKKLFSAFEPL